MGSLLGQMMQPLVWVVALSAQSAYRCELLCFVQNKSKVLALEDLITICVDFYTVVEINAARTVLQSPGARPVKKVAETKWERHSKVQAYGHGYC